MSKEEMVRLEEIVDDLALLAPTNIGDEPIHLQVGGLPPRGAPASGEC